MKSVILAALVAFAPAASAAAQTAGLSDFDRGVELRRQGQSAEAIAYLEAATRKSPNDADAWLNLGLAYATTDRFSDAETALSRAAQIAPDYADVQIARARLAYFRDDPAEAERRLAPVLAAHPDNTEAQTLAHEIRAARVAGVSPWRFDASYTHGNLSKGLPHTETQTLSLTRRLGGGQVLGGSLDRTEQFGVADTYGELIYAAKAFYLAAGATPNAHFRPKWALRGGLYAKALRSGGWSLQPLIDGRWARYPVGDVQGVTPGVDIAQGVVLTLRVRWINVFDENHDYRSGYSVGGDLRPGGGRIALLAGYANAPETSEGVTQRVKTFDGGFALDVTSQTTVRIVGAREKRPAYTRKDVTVSLTHRF